MRRSVLSVVLAAALSLVACSDQLTEPRPPDRAPALLDGPLGCTIAPTAASLLTQVNQLLPRSPLRTSVILLIGALPSRFQDRIKAAVRRVIFQIDDLILKAFYAGRLTGGTSADTYNKVLRLIEALHCYVGMTPPSFPSTTTGSDVVVGVAQPNVAFNFTTPSGEAGVAGGATAVTTAMGPVLISIHDLPNSPPPLRTTLDQYPRFYHFSGTTAAGVVVFNVPITAAVCLRAPFAGDPSALRLAHNVGPNFGDVEVLPRPASGPAGVSCPDLGPSPTGSIPAGSLGRFAWAKKLLLPAELHAASLAMIELPPVGGNTRRFSEFGIVDPGSNPASINFNPNAATFSELSALPGTTVTPAPSVVVKSQNGTPIPNVPVNFAVGEAGGTVNGASTATVTTGANGIATVTSWVLGSGPGTYTLTATPPDLDATTGNPTTGVPPHPPAKFTPTSLTFTATAANSSAGVISNGTITLGVNQTGNLIVSSAETFVGLRFAGAEALAVGTMTEGWGVARTGSIVTGYANVAQGAPVGLTIESFSRTLTEARSVVRIGSTFRVVHDFKPPSSPLVNVYQVDVAIENISGEPQSNVVYRRVMDWDIPPTEFSEFVSVRGTTSTPGVSATNNGPGASANPLDVPPGGTGGDGTGDFSTGPSDRGAVFDLTFDLGAGATKTFVLYYGAAANTDAAKAVALSAGAEVLSLARPDVAPLDGSPNTFIAAFRGLGGPALTSSAMGGMLRSTAPASLLRLPSGQAQRQIK